MLLVDRHHRQSPINGTNTQKNKMHRISRWLWNGSGHFIKPVLPLTDFCVSRWSLTHFFVLLVGVEAQEGVNIFFCCCYIYVPCVPPSFVVSYIFFFVLWAWRKREIWRSCFSSIFALCSIVLCVTRLLSPRLVTIGNFLWSSYWREEQMNGTFWHFVIVKLQC